MSTKKQIEVIEAKCDELGLNIREVFRRADIPEATIGNWRRKEPDAFTVIGKINETISLMKLEQEYAADFISNHVSRRGQLPKQK